MAEILTETGEVQRDRRIYTYHGVRVHGRQDDRGCYTQLDAIDEGQDTIRQIADRLQRHGYGVTRERHNRAGRVYYTCKATWIGRGNPPDDPINQEPTSGEPIVKSKLIQDQGGEKTYAVVFETGDEAVAGLREFARRNNLGGARFTAIGAFSGATLGYFDWQTKEYRKIPIREQVEVLSLVGDIALDHGEPQLHAHVVLGRSDGSTRGGHLLEAHVRPTLEVMLVEAPEHLHKEHDPQSGLALIRL